MSQLAALDSVRAGAVRQLWPQLRDTPVWSGPPLWLHGDPHPADVVVGTGTWLR